MNSNMVLYYKERAKEYEKIYWKPERQNDLQSASTILQDHFFRKLVFEVACGNGYWTEKIAKSANSIYATDINEAVIEIAKQKEYSNANVTFRILDIFNCDPIQQFESLFGGFIWSHILLQDLDQFLRTINKFVSPGGTVVFIDNNFVEGSSLPVTEIDEQGNTYQTRKLENGSTHLVVKNFSTESFISERLAGIATDIKFINFKYYWILSYFPK